jgi:ribose/xylose/arabinose/galactoside ABC-type transport system permease subunit
VPVWLVAILAVAVGAVIGLLVGWIKGRRRS